MSTNHPADAQKNQWINNWILRQGKISQNPLERVLPIIKNLVTIVTMVARRHFLVHDNGYIRNQGSYDHFIQLRRKNERSRHSNTIN